MALVLLRLRLAITRRGRGHGLTARIWYVATWVIALVLGLAAAAVVGALESLPGSVGDFAVVAAFSVVFVAWVLLPITVPALADTAVDPARLEPYPLGRTEQVAGLTLGALVTPTSLFTLLFAAGGSLAVDAGGGARLLVLGGALAYVVLCVSVSRAVQAMLSGALGSRRGRDAATIVFGLLVLGIYVLTQTAANRDPASGGGISGGWVGSVLSWLPPGAAGQGTLDARDGDYAAMAAHAAVVVVTTVLAFALWAWALGRRVEGGGSGPRRPRTDRGADTDLALVPGPLQLFAPGPALAAGSQHLRYFFFRSPKAMQSITLTPVMGAFVAHTQGMPRGLVLGTAVFAAFATLACQFGAFNHDGRGFALVVMSGTPMRSVLAGKMLVPLVLVFPTIALFALVEAALGGLWSDAWTALLAGAAVAVLGAGVGALDSVLNPQDMTQRSPTSGRVLETLAWILGFFAVLAVGAGVWLALELVLPSVLVGLVCLVAAGGVAAALLRVAGRRLEADPFAVLARVAPGAV